MRVLVASDGIVGLESGAAGDVIGAAFAEHGAEVAVVPLATGGEPLARALRRIDDRSRVVGCHSLDEVLRALGERGEGRCHLDLTLMAEITFDEVVSAARDTDLAGVARGHGPELVAVVPESDVGLPLTGMPGAIAARDREAGVDLSVTLERNARAERWLQEIDVADAPGSGALGGIGALVRAAGGRVVTGVQACAEASALDRVVRQADVAVTGAGVLDFIDVGGPVVKHVATIAQEALVPVIAIVGRCYVSPRELRLSGIEGAYPVVERPDAPEPNAEQFSQTCRRVAATWRW